MPPGAPGPAVAPVLTMPPGAPGPAVASVLAAGPAVEFRLADRRVHGHVLLARQGLDGLHDVVGYRPAGLGRWALVPVAVEGHRLADPDAHPVQLRDGAARRQYPVGADHGDRDDRQPGGEREPADAGAPAVEAAIR